MQTGSVGKRRIHERLADVDAAPGRLQHPFDEIAQGRVGETQLDAFGDSAAGDVDALGTVEPDLLGNPVDAPGRGSPLGALLLD